jgi:hypothetical protein
MSLVFEKFLGPGRAQRSIAEGNEPRLNITAVFTSVESTLSALKKAGAVAQGLNAHITLIVGQIVPYPLPLASPPVLLDFNERRFRVLAGASPVETTVRIYLCRDRMEMLQTVLKPRSIVVVGARKSWWPSPEKRLARSLRRAGHQVILTES